MNYRKPTVLEAHTWSAVLDRAMRLFGRNELAEHAVRTKPESRLRLALCAALQRETGFRPAIEWPVYPGKVDIVLVDAGEPVVWLEVKTGYSFDAVCAGGATLLAGKYGRKNSVAADVAKLQRAASGRAYVLYASVHPNGPLPESARGAVMVRDYFDKHAAALRRYGNADRLPGLVDRMCDQFGRTGEVDGYLATEGRFPLVHVLTHQAIIGHTLGVGVWLQSWVWEVPAVPNQVHGCR